ncbi:MFS transporter [Clostridium sp.]|uniref:MFS transporter n=1 Tax=Clostridium sp. TaxID=1506 RepID=UPI003F2C6CFB
MKKKSMNYLLILTFLISIVLNMAHPVTPVLIKSLGLPSIMFGIFFASMSLGNFFFSPIWGGLSDSKGRIRFLIIGLLGYGVSQLGFGFIENTFLIVVFRVLGGAFVTSYLTVALAYLTDITNSENRIKYMSYYAGATTFGGALGALLGGVIGNNNYKITFLWQFILSAILCFALYFMLGETIEKKKEKIKLKLTSFSFKKYGSILNRNLTFIMLMVVMFYFASTSYNSTINFYIESVLNLPPTFNGVFISIAGIIGFLANILITPYIGKKFESEDIFKYITLILSIVITIVALIPNIILFFFFIIIFVSVCSIYIPIQQNIVTKLSKDNYGALMGLQNSAKAVGMVIGSLFAGAIFDFGAKLPFLASGIVLFIGFILLTRVKIETK